MKNVEKQRKNHQKCRKIIKYVEKLGKSVKSSEKRLKLSKSKKNCQKYKKIVRNFEKLRKKDKNIEKTSKISKKI